MDQTTKAAESMKRYGNLWSRIISFENLLLATRRAQRGKRFQRNVLTFNANLENELLRLEEELTNQTYQPGSYRTFEIFEPKRRLISAAPYRDRVVHHALCNIIEPIFEKSFIFDSYANRKGKGTHRALDRFVRFARSSNYILQCDICKYFPSIDHEILKSLLRRKIKCARTLWLTDTIIDYSNPQEPIHHSFAGDDLFTPFERKKGLPIGNLTSQFFANIYLNHFDHYVKEYLKVKKYVRFVDDFALFGNDASFLKDARYHVEDYLSKYRLRIHPVKSQLFRTKKGANFLGFRVLPDQIRVRSENLKKAKRRYRQLGVEYYAGTIKLDKIGQSIQSWIAHLRYGNTWRLREHVFSSLVFRRG